MTDLTIAVIIPVLNAESTINRCLDSILSQGYKNFEILIQDGGSIDKTYEIIADYVRKDNRIRYFNLNDTGIYDAMNKLIPEVRAEWIIFLGSDDCLFNSDVFTEFVRHIYKGFNIYYGNVCIEGKVQWATNYLKYDGVFDLKKLLKRNICHQAIFYRKSLLLSHNAPYNTSYFISADWDLNLRLWSKESFYYIDFIVSKFKSGGISSSKHIDKKFKADFIFNILKYYGGYILFMYLYRITINLFIKKFNFRS